MTSPAVPTRPGCARSSATTLVASPPSPGTSCDGRRAHILLVGAGTAPVGRLRGSDANALVQAAAAGDQRAWGLLVARFDVTIRAQARRHGLAPHDRDEVAQRTWLALHRHVDKLGTHPAIGGWLILTARRESLRVLAASKRELPAEDPVAGRESTDPPIDDALLASEREAIRQAILRLPVHERRLVALLLREPDLTYQEVSAMLSIPKGSIGPTRGRCIARLRGDRHLVNVITGRPQPGHDLA